MLRRWLVLSLCIVNSHSQSCQKWSEEDQSNNDCRACRVITIDRLANCPETGYACDEREPLSAAVLSSSDTCRCQSLRCAHKEWRLAVNGTIVDKVRCNGKQWVSSGLVAPSFVCASKKELPFELEFAIRFAKYLYHIVKCHIGVKGFYLRK